MPKLKLFYQWTISIMTLVVIMASQSCQESCPSIEEPDVLKPTSFTIQEGDSLFLETEKVDGYVARWQLPNGEVVEGYSLYMGEMQETWEGYWKLALKDENCIVERGFGLSYTDLSPECSLEPNTFRLKSEDGSSVYELDSVQKGTDLWDVVYYHAFFGDHEVKIGFAKDLSTDARTIIPGVYRTQYGTRRQQFHLTAGIFFDGESNSYGFEDEKQLYMRRSGSGFIVGFCDWPLGNHFTGDSLTASTQFYFDEK